MSARILITSLGSIGKRHLRNARALAPDARIAVLRRPSARSEPKPAEADEVCYDLPAAVAFRPDVSILASPAPSHPSEALALLRAGSHLFIEKPLAATAAALAEFRAAAPVTDRFIMVGYVLRFLPVLHAIRAALAEGRIGRVCTAHVQVGQYLPDWRPGSDYRAGVSAQAALGGGALLELSHEIDYALWLFGKPLSLQCSLAHASGLDLDVEDSAHLILEYANPDKRVLVQLDFLQRTPYMAVRAVGTEGTLIADLIRETASVLPPGGREGIPLAAEALPNGNAIYLRQFDFLFAKTLPAYRPVYEGSPGFTHWVDVESAAAVLDLVDAARIAHSQGKRQALA
jgi:predicted dehydrogenase